MAQRRLFNLPAERVPGGTTVALGAWKVSHVRKMRVKQLVLPKVVTTSSLDSDVVLVVIEGASGRGSTLTPHVYMSADGTRTARYTMSTLICEGSSTTYSSTDRGFDVEASEPFDVERVNIRLLRASDLTELDYDSTSATHRILVECEFA